MKKTILTLVAAVVAACLLISCSLPPVKPVTRKELMKTRIYNRFIIVEGKRNIPGRDFPIYLKLLATTGGIHVLDYDR